jgi:hypothetical protein
VAGMSGKSDREIRDGSFILFPQEFLIFISLAVPSLQNVKIHFHHLKIILKPSAVLRNNLIKVEYLGCSSVPKINIFYNLFPAVFVMEIVSSLSAHYTFWRP